MSFFKNIFKKITGVGADEKSSEAITSDLSVATVDEESLADFKPKVDPDKKLDEEYLEELEEELIKSDLGVQLSLDFIDRLRSNLKKQDLRVADIPEQLKAYLVSAFEKDIEDETFKLNINESKLSIFLVVGVNGVGKTTSIAKLAHRFKQENKKVLIAAGDTFRAAAEEQLRIWAERVQADFVELEHGAKSSAVVYKAIEEAKDKGHDILIVDTAGRLQNKKNLMEELSKIKQVIEKNTEAGTLAETMLVLDASTGQNALSQAEAFNEICELSSIILTKFDGTAKAGVVFSIAHNFHIPVKLLGVGEGMGDLKDFVPAEFIAKYI